MCVEGDQSPSTAPEVEVHTMIKDMSQEDLEGMMKEKVGVGQEIVGQECQEEVGVGQEYQKEVGISQEYQEDVGIGQAYLIHKDQPPVRNVRRSRSPVRRSRSPNRQQSKDTNCSMPTASKYISHMVECLIFCVASIGWSTHRNDFVCHHVSH